MAVPFSSSNCSVRLQVSDFAMWATRHEFVSKSSLTAYLHNPIVIMLHLLKVANCDPILVHNPGSGGRREADGSWTGRLGLLVNGTIDVTRLFMIPHDERMEDFISTTYPIRTYPLGYLISKASVETNVDYQWWKVMHWKVWICFLLLLLVCQAWKTLRPESAVNSLILFDFCFFMFQAAFSGTLTTFQISRSTVPFKNFVEMSWKIEHDEFVWVDQSKSGFLQTVLKGSLRSDKLLKQAFSKNCYQILDLPSDAKFIAKIEETPKFFFVSSYPVLQSWANNHKKLYSYPLENAGLHYDLAFLRKSSITLRRKIDSAIVRFQEMDIAKYNPQYLSKTENPPNNPSVTSETAFSTYQLKFVISVLLISNLLSLGLYFLAYLHFRRTFADLYRVTPYNDFQNPVFKS